MLVTKDEVVIKTYTYFVTVKNGKYVEIDEPEDYGSHDDLWFWNKNLQINTHIIIIYGDEADFIDSDVDFLCHICDLCDISFDDEQLNYPMVTTIVPKYY